ncbi:MAG: BMP family protein [Desulfovibrionaceae bacterium]|nr:BMP family ABC transporter substrate-binding protein [Desulfovibrionaceae bacterium]
MPLFHCLLLCLLLLCPAPVHAAAPLRVTLLLESGGGDSGWNDSLLAGLREAQKRWKCRTTVLVARNPDEQEESFARAASSSDLVIVPTTAFHTLLRSRAGDYPKTRFGCIDVAAPAPNIMSFIFADAEVSFLAGAAAGMLARDTRVPGIRGGDDLAWISGKNTAVSQNMRNAFAMGAHTVDPSLRVVDKVLGTYSDPELGHAVALQLYSSGIDIIASSAGASGLGCLRAARESGRYAFGADANQDDLAPGHVIFSIIKRADMAVLKLVEAAATDSFQGRAVVSLDLKSGGVDISDMAPLKRALGGHMPPRLESRLRELRRELELGRIDVTTRKKGQLCDCL